MQQKLAQSVHVLRARTKNTCQIIQVPRKLLKIQLFVLKTHHTFLKISLYKNVFTTKISMKITSELFGIKIQCGLFIMNSVGTGKYCSL